MPNYNGSPGGDHLLPSSFAQAGALTSESLFQICLTLNIVFFDQQDNYTVFLPYCKAKSGVFYAKSLKFSENLTFGSQKLKCPLKLSILCIGHVCRS